MHIFESVAAAGIFLFAAALAVLAAVVLATLARNGRRRPRGTGPLRVSPLADLMLASMFLGFQKLVHPHVRHPIVEELHDQDGEDPSGQPAPRGGWLLHRQLRRIRLGEEGMESESLQVARDPPEP